MGGVLTQTVGRPAVVGGGGGFGAHAYWMLEIDANNGGATRTALSSLRFYDSSNSLIATTGGTSFSSGSGSDEIGGDNSKAFDGNDATTWSRSSTTNTKIGYQFASAVAVVSIEIVGGSNGDTPPKTCRLRYSDDGATYTTAFEIWEPSWVASGQSTRAWPQDVATKWKSIRWRVTNGNGARFYVMNEAELHATIAGSDICNNGRASTSGNAGTGTTPDQLFDNNTATSFQWDSFASSPSQIPGWVAYAFAETVAKPAEYSMIQNTDPSNGWRDWKIQATNDGVTWTDLDTQTGITWSSTPQTQTFSIP